MTVTADVDIANPTARRASGALRALRLGSSGGMLTVGEVAVLIRRGTWGRLGFAILIAIIGTSILPWELTLGWAAFMTTWEVALRPWCDDLAVKVSEKSEQRGVEALALIHFLGGSAYAVFPIAAWASQTPIGMVLATGWVCGAATHAFVYFASHRTILVAVLIPIAALVLVAPFAVSGLTPIAFTGALTLGCLVLSAGLVGHDRELLLSIIARHATARAAAEQSDRAKSQFLATMSHELRTPLNAIIGYSEMIEEEGAGAVADDAGKIKTSAHQLLGVINSILDVSKLEAGTVEIERESVELEEIVDQIREASAPLVAVNGNSFRLDARNDLGAADLDHMRVHQAVMHLIGNAAKFTRNGAIRVAVSRAAHEGKPVIQFVVADTGVGVPEHERERIFEPFVQVETEAGRRFEGAGLGLTFARRIARLMGGDVVCTAAPGGGAAFTLWVAA